MNLTDILKDERIQSILSEIVPYVPTLKDMAKEKFDVWVKAVANGDWPAADKMIVAAMTPEQRDTLCLEATRLAISAAVHQLDEEQLAKEVLIKLALAAAMAAAGAVAL